MASNSGGLHTLRLSNYLRYYCDDLAVHIGIEEDIWDCLEWKASELLQGYSWKKMQMVLEAEAKSKVAVKELLKKLFAVSQEISDFRFPVCQVHCRHFESAFCEEVQLHHSCKKLESFDIIMCESNVHKVTLTIRPGVVMEFAPNVGILVLGVLKVQGVRGQEIMMRPMTSLADLEGNKVTQRRCRQVLPFENDSESVRLCAG